VSRRRPIADVAGEFVRRANAGERPEARVRKDSVELFLGELVRAGFRLADACLEQIRGPRHHPYGVALDSRWRSHSKHFHRNSAPTPKPKTLNCTALHRQRHRGGGQLDRALELDLHDRVAVAGARRREELAERGVRRLLTTGCCSSRPRRLGRRRWRRRRRSPARRARALGHHRADAIARA
jgi:hypothetical protein